MTNFNQATRSFDLCTGGFTAEEIEADLRDDVDYLANALQAWLEGDDEPEDDETEPQPFGVETAVRLLEEGYIEEGAGIKINRAKGHAGEYHISMGDDHIYSVVWSYGINAQHAIKTQAEVAVLLVGEAQLGATFWWQTMPNNDWELTNAPTLPVAPKGGTTPDKYDTQYQQF